MRCLHKYFLLAFTFFATEYSVGQDYNPNAGPNSFASESNPNYWKNKSIKPGYWQQDVHYTMTARIDEKRYFIEATTELVYTNNSPDTLSIVAFHLYQNAFQPGAYYDNLQKNNGVDPIYSDYEEMGLGTVVSNMRVNGDVVDTSMDNTILFVHLNEPLLPNDGITLHFDFQTFYGFGSSRRRMKLFNSYGAIQFNGAHWYPRIAVYDEKFGWNVDQHLSREFYGDFGTFDVTLDFPSNYVVGATGFLQNRDEVLPAELRAKLDIENFKDKPWGEAPSTITPYVEGERKQWHYYAENVHDFAFTANPHYRIGESEWQGVKTYALCQEPHSSRWQNAAEYTAAIIQVFSEDIGMYGYPKMIVADARDGMEYPMLTLDGDKDPGYRDLLVHEVGHNWFYGMVANNETYRAMMDEGFTQFLTAWGLEAIDGVNYVTNTPSTPYLRKFKEPVEAREGEVYIGYMMDATLGQDPQLNTHSDGFDGALRHGGGYGHVYYKTAVMLYNLQYVLGDSLFLAAMQHYFDQWSYAHPYPEDFRHSIIDFTGVDLNWFFDQWIETNKSIDYSISSKKETAENTYTITLERHGRMQMPIDLQLEDQSGTTYDFHIPNQYFEKSTEATILPKWTGWDKLHPTYSFTVELEDKLANATIDTTNRLADINAFNNRLKGNTIWRFNSHVYNFPSRKHYIMEWRPDLWWNGVDGLKLGLHVEGNYMRRKRFFDFTIWGNLSWPTLQRSYQGAPAFLNSRRAYQGINYRLSYATPVYEFIDGATAYVKSKYLDGLIDQRLGIQKELHGKGTLRLEGFAMIRPNEEDLSYLQNPEQGAWWVSGAWNAGLNLQYTSEDFRKARPGKSQLKLSGRVSMTPDWNYQYLEATFTDHMKIGKFDWKNRLYSRFGFGKTPPESAVYLAGGNPESMMDNKFVRSVGFYPQQEIGPYQNNSTTGFHYAGGMNLRGYAGRLVTDESGQSLVSGRSGLSVSSELSFDRLINIKNSKLRRNYEANVYLFADAGLINSDPTARGRNWSTIYADAGLGLALTWKRFFKLYNLKPFTFRIDCPFWVSDPGTGNQNIYPRLIFGFNQTF